MRFKKGELDFYKKHTPIELEELYSNLPERQESIMKFIEEYRYNFVKKEWVKD